MEANREPAEQSRGMRVILALAVLTIVEFIVALNIGSTPLVVVLLAAMALAKGWLIVTYFMHVALVVRGEEAHR